MILYDGHYHPCNGCRMSKDRIRESLVDMTGQRSHVTFDPALHYHLGLRRQATTALSYHATNRDVDQVACA